MADIKISQLNSLSSADLKDSDVLVINDVSVSTTKQITREAFLDGFTRNVVDSGTGAKIAGDFTVDNELTVGGDLETTGKITFGSLQDHAEGIFISKFVDAADTIANNLTDSSIPTSLAVRDYVALQTASNIAGLLNVDSAGAQTVLYPVMVKDPDGDEDSALTDPDLSYNANTRTLTSGNLVPLADSEYNLGSASKKWKELFISGSTINIGDKKIQIDNNKVNFVGATGFQLDGVDFSGGGGANPVATARLLPTGGQVIRYDSSGTTELGGDQTLTFKGVVGGFTGSRTFKFFVDGVEKSSQTLSIDSATYTMLDGDEPAANASKTVKLLVTGSGDSEASDFVSVFGVKDGASAEDGTDGNDGVSAVTTFLTNEVHTVSADSAGVLTSNLSSAGGTMKVFVGATDVTGNASVTYSNPSETGISASIASTGVYTIASFDSDGRSEGVATFRAVVDQSLIQGATGDVTVEKQYSIAKQLGGGGLDGADGAAGINARAVKIIANDGQVIRYDSSGAEVDTLTFTAHPENQDLGTEVTYRWSVRSPGGSYTAKQNSGTTDYTLADADEPGIEGVKIIKCEMYEDSVEAAQDTMTVYGLVNGFSITGFLTNETHVEPADSVGVLTTSLSDAGGTFKVFLGTTDITTSSSVSYSNTANTGVNVSIDAGGDGGVTSGQYTINSFSSDATLTGTADFRATVAQALIPGASSDFIIDKKYSISKARQGVTGEGVGIPGADARAVKLIPNNGQVIRYDSAGNEGDSLTFTAENNGVFTGTETWQFLLKKGAGASYVSKQAASATTTFTLADADEPGVDSAYIVQVRAYENGTEKASDFVTVYGLQNGGSITAFLTNESHVEGYDSNGTIVDNFSDAGGTFKVFRGTTDITTDCTFSKQSQTNMTSAIVSGTGVYSVSGLTAKSGKSVFRADVPASLVPGGSGNNLLIDKQYSISKSIDGSSGLDGGNGAAGTSARAVKLIPNDGQVIRYDADGTTETDTLTFTADNNDAFTGTETYQFLLKKGGGASYVSKKNSGSTAFTLADADEPSVDSAYTLQVKAFEDSVEKANDFVTIYGLQNGTGISAFLTNESHVEGYDSNGDLIDDLTDAGGTFKVFRGTTEITSNCTFSVQSETGVDVSINSGSGVYTVNSLSADKGNADFQASVPATLVPGGTAAMLIDKTYSIAKSKTGSSGTDGTNGADGDDARAVKLIPTAGQVIRYAADGTTETDTLTFNADNNAAFTGTETWQYRLDKGSGTFASIQAASATATHTLSDGNEPGVDSAYIVQVRAYEDGVLKATDQVSIFGLQNGAGLTAFLTNESHVEGYDSNGDLVDNFSDAGGTFKVFRGTTDITTNCTFSKQSNTNMTSAIVSGTGVYSVSALTAKNGNSVFRATVPSTLVPGGGSDLTIDKTYTISKSQDGGSGDDGGDGSRGPGRWHIDCDSINYAAAGNTNGNVPATAAGAAEAWDEGSFVGTSPGAEVAGDQAWFFEGTIANPTAQKVWIYNGSAWAEQTEAIDGNLLVAGTVTADEFVTSGIIDSSANTGRTTIKNSGITIESWETNQMVVRVKIGDLS